MPRKPAATPPDAMPRRRALLVRLCLAAAYTEPSDAFRLWKSCDERACRRRKCCAMDLFEAGPPPCVRRWDVETLRAACQNLSGFLNGVELGGMLFGPPPRGAPVGRHLPEGYTLDEIIAGAPWEESE